MFKRPPEALAIVVAVLLIFLVLTWIIPGGKYARIQYTGEEPIIILPLTEPEFNALENTGKAEVSIPFGTSALKGTLQKESGGLIRFNNDYKASLSDDILSIPAEAFGALEQEIEGSNYMLRINESTQIPVRKGKELVIPGSYKEIKSSPRGLTDFLLAPIKGFTEHYSALIIAFVLIVGGAFSILTATGAIDAALQRLIRIAVRNKRFKIWIIPLLMSIFSLGGCTFGMAEEVLVFILITLPLARSLGYDNFVGVAIPFLGAAVGFAGAAINPFTVGIAQGIAQLPPGSGAGYRWIVWATYTLAAILFVMWYARKIEKKQVSLPAPEVSDEPEPISFDWRRKMVLFVFLSALVVLMIGAQQWDWYIEEISALFVAMAFITAIISELNVKRTVEAFVQGAKDLLPAALIIGLSKSILLVAEDGRIIDTVLYGFASGLEGVPSWISAQLMFLVHGGINFFIPSGSGQAAITMPIMTPLADLLGISRQTAVLAFQFGDGLFNLIIPTSGVTMGVISIAGISFNAWLRWIGKFFLLMVLLSMILLVFPTVFFTWN